MTVWLSQWLCPARHASIGYAWDDAVETADAVAARGEAQFRPRGPYNRWCGICLGDLVVEHAPTSFATMDAARPHLAQLMIEQARSRRALDDLGLSSEPGSHPGAPRRP